MATILAENPLRTGTTLHRTAEPCAVVIMGATGDLAHRMLLPALYNLAVDHLLPHGFAVVGFARQEQAHDDFRTDMRKSVNSFSRFAPIQDKVWDSFAEGLFFQSADFGDLRCYQELAQLLQRVDEERGTQGNRIFYLAVPPTAVPTIIANMGQAGLVTADATGEHWSRIVIEKPFGRDLASAQTLNTELLKVFKENQIYRIDHYLGKETVQNLLVFRFANGLFDYGIRRIGHRSPGRVLRDRRSAARHVPESHSAARHAHGDGAPGSARRQCCP